MRAIRGSFWLIVAMLFATGCTIENIDRQEGTAPLPSPPTVTGAADTDGDGLSDEQEQAIGTSIDLADTDGDGLSDEEEVTNGGFDPLIADLPNITIDIIDSPSIQIDVTYATATTKETNFSASFAQGKESSYSRSDTTATSSTIETSTKISAEASASFGPIPGGSASVGTESSVAASSTKEFSTNTTATAARSSREEYANYQGQTAGENIKAEKGTLAATLQISNASTLAYELSSVSVIAKKRSADGRTVNSIGTLRFSTGEPEVLSPGERIQSEVNTDKTSLPVLKELMSNPSGLILTVGSYAIRELGEDGLDFALQSQEVASKTAQVVIDYGDNLADGNSPTETYMVATNVARDPVTLETRGITMQEVMQDILAIDYQTTAQNVPDENGQPTADTRQILSAVRNQASVDTANGFWYVFTNSQSMDDPATDFDDIVLMPRDRITMVYLADADGDRLFNREEYLLGTDFDSVDSDGDGLTDYDETRTGWVVQDGSSQYRVYSDPLNVDSDGDLVSDLDERDQQTDPDRQDTDGDLVSDLDDEDPNGGVSGVAFKLDFIGPGQEITVTGGVEPANELSQVRIDWGDGNGEQVITQNLSNIRASRSYLAKGNFVITVTADRIVGSPVQRQYDLALADPIDSGAGGLADWNGQRYRRELVDVNADGFDDLIGFGPDGVWVALGSDSGFTPAILVQDEFADDDMDVANPNADGVMYTSKRFIMANVGGDAAPDIVAFDADGVRVSINNGSGGFEQSDVWVNAFAADDSITPKNLLADVNSDGLDDIVAFESNGVHTAISFGINFDLQDPAIHREDYGSGWTDNHPRVLADVNGDGYPDIVGFHATRTQATLNDQTGAFSGDIWTVPAMSVAQGYRVPDHPRLAVDVTGPDSPAADLVAFANAGAYGIRSTPDGFDTRGFFLSSEFGFFDGWRAEQHPRYIADINNDGHADLVGFSPTEVVYALNSGNDGTFERHRNWPLADAGRFIYEGASSQQRSRHNARLVGDVNGDGMADLVAVDESSINIEFGARITVR